MIDALAAAGWPAGWLAAGRIHRLPTPAAGTPRPTTSVVVPVRDESVRLPGLLAALAADGSPGRPEEVIVVDDSSTDGCGRLAAAAGAVVVSVDRPPGWTGKAWACWHGALAASGEVLVFLDADTEPAPGFIARLSCCAAATDGMVSVQPTHRVERPFERASATCNAVALMAGTGSVSPLPGRGPLGWWRRPVAFGPAIAVPRRRYLDSGGHGLVRADVVDDLALAHAMAGAGVPVSAYADASAGALCYRMYPEGPASLVEGWTKNLAAGAGKIAPLRAALIGLWVAGALHAAVGLVTGFGAATAIAYGVYAVQARVLFRRAGRFGPLASAAYPLPMLAFVALFARSAVHRVWRRPVAWRGRTVPL